MKKNITREDVEEMKKLWAEKVKLPKIALRFGRDRTTIMYHLGMKKRSREKQLESNRKWWWKKNHGTLPPERISPIAPPREKGSETDKIILKKALENQKKVWAITRNASYYKVMAKNQVRIPRDMRGSQIGQPVVTPIKSTTNFYS